MKLQTYLFLIFVITLIALGTWFLILFNINPHNTDLISISAFFASLLLWLSGISTLILFYLRIKLSNKEIIFVHLPLSLRQGFLFSLAIVLVILLLSLSVLTWWSGILLMISIFLLELFFMRKKVHK